MNKITDEQIERKIKNAIDDMTPDMLDDLMSELDSATVTEFPESPIPKRHRKRRWYTAVASCAAALLIFVGAFSMLHKADDVCAVVSLDVNPSVELSINTDNQVLSAKSLNSDGEKILGGMDLEGTDVKVACNALVGSMVKNGYLSDLSNSVLVSVQSDDETKGHEVEKMVAGDLSNSITNSDISGAVIGQYIASDDEIAEFANTNGISQGKAWLIKNLMTTNSKHMTEESLLQLSTQDLILLSQERDVKVDDSYCSANTSNYISKEDAVKAGIAKAGVDETQVNNLTVEYDCDDGIMIYEVDFSVGNQEYEYDVNCETGEILDFESDIDDGDDRDDDHDDDDDDDDDIDDDDDDEDDDD